MLPFYHPSLIVANMSLIGPLIVADMPLIICFYPAVISLFPFAVFDGKASLDQGLNGWAAKFGKICGTAVTGALPAARPRCRAKIPPALALISLVPRRLYFTCKFRRNRRHAAV